MKKHHQVSIYVSPASQMCYLTKEFFRSAGIDFYEHDVAKNPERMKKMIQESGQSSTPVTIIDGRVICGYQPEVFNTILGEGENRAPVQ